MSAVTVTSLANLQNEVSWGDAHSFITDEPVAAGGGDANRAAAVGKALQNGLI